MLARRPSRAHATPSCGRPTPGCIRQSSDVAQNQALAFGIVEHLVHRGVHVVDRCQRQATTIHPARLKQFGVQRVEVRCLDVLQGHITESRCDVRVDDPPVAVERRCLATLIRQAIEPCLGEVAHGQLRRLDEPTRLMSSQQLDQRGLSILLRSERPFHLSTLADFVPGNVRYPRRCATRRLTSVHRAIAHAASVPNLLPRPDPIPAVQVLKRCELGF